MIVHVKSRWNIIHFKVSPFDMSNVSPYLKQTLKFQFPHFCFRDDFVHLQECSSLLVRYFHFFKQSILSCLLFYVDMRNLTDKALQHVYML